MNYFLAKTDPETYSIGDLEREKKTTWDGVTNAQAVRAIREMKPGDRVFIYHSGGNSAVLGLATIRSEGRTDPKNPKSAIVDLEFTGRLEPPTTLAEIKQSGKFTIGLWSARDACRPWPRLKTSSPGCVRVIPRRRSSIRRMYGSSRPGDLLGVSSQSIVIATPATFEDGARTQPVARRWVLSGEPMTRTWNVLRSHDLTSDIVVWECTAGRFECRYRVDEAVMIVEGEVFITDEKGEERRLGPGDLGFFPAGSSCVWRVPERVRKIAILRETLWKPAGFGLKVWKRLLLMTGLSTPGPAAA